MATLRDIKQRIAGVKKTQQITRALKMVAAVKFRKAQQNILQARPYAYRLDEIMGHVAYDVDSQLHPLLAVREPRRVGYVIITADQGLCGSFNANILRHAEREIQMQGDREIDLILIGKKGVDYFARRRHNVIGTYLKFFKDLSFRRADEIEDLIRDLYLEQKLDRISLIYNEYKSAMRQDVTVEQILPVIPRPPVEDRRLAEFAFEPDAVKMLDTLIPRYLNVKIWRVLLESYASEMGARMTAMEYATENADTIISELTMDYNKLRQQKITAEILEIVNGSEALKQVR
ncbi:MAG: ATP synthase F1 subunit gamma [Calditrichaeota bacterium]|nr:ATP synthase F1 subunit gamma [Calditrichota bacterium]